MARVGTVPEQFSISPRSPKVPELGFRLMLDALPDAVVAADGTYKIVFVNAAAERLLGWPADELVGRPLAMLLPQPPSDGDASVEEPSSALKALPIGRAARVPVLMRDGSEAVFEVTISPTSSPNGGAVCTYRDVTTQLRLEAERAERATQLKALVDHLPVGVAYFDALGVCRACNGPARRILGRPRGETIGATADELIGQAPGLCEALKRCVGGQAAHVQAGVAWPDPGGESPRFLDWRFEPLVPDPARPLGALALIVDVTDRIRTEAELQRARDVAEHASRNKTRFLSAVSHDLRTPVNALSLQAELLAGLIADREGCDGDDLSLLAGDIRKAAGNLIDLINDLLDLTRFDSGEIEHHTTVFPLDDWLVETLAPLEVMARSKGLEFAWQVDRPGHLVRADRVKLGRVLVNLTGNAVKFTDHGEVVVFAGAGPGGWLALRVHDTGPGIPDDQRERIFDEFAQLRNPERDRTKGTGLGLAICRRLVEAVGGRLEVESRLGMGSTFTALYPPDHLPESPSLPERTEPPPGLPPTIDAPILLVEDDPHSRTALTRLLQRAGYSVEPAADGPSALAVLDRTRPSLVLLDLMMPGMDGAECLRQMRARPAGRDLPVVVLSGDVMGDRVDELRPLGVIGMLAKPVDFNDLLCVVARHARSRTKAG